VKTESNSLGASLGLAISLGISVMLTWLSIVASCWMAKRPTCA
jgi:hypothetical protein